MVDAAEIVMLVLCLVAGMVVQRLTGMGSNLVIAPYLILIFGPIGGVALVNVVGMITATICCALLWRDIEWRVYWRLLAGAVVGCLPGVVVVNVLPQELLAPLIGGILILGLVLSRMLSVHLAGSNHSALSVIFGFLSGTINVISGAGGLAIAIFAIVTHWDHRRFSATFQPFFVVVALLSVGLTQFTLENAIPGLSLPMWGLVAACLLFGAVLGGPIARRLPLRIARLGMVLVATAGSLGLILGAVL